MPVDEKTGVPGILQETGWEIFVRTNERTEGKIVRTGGATWMAIKMLKLLDLRADRQQQSPATPFSWKVVGAIPSCSTSFG